MSILTILTLSSHGMVDGNPSHQASHVAAALEPSIPSGLAALRAKGLPEALLRLQLRSAALGALPVPRHVLLLLHLSPAVKPIVIGVVSLQQPSKASEAMRRCSSDGLQ